MGTGMRVTPIAAPPEVPRVTREKPGFLHSMDGVEEEASEQTLSAFLDDDPLAEECRRIAVEEGLWTAAEVSLSEEAESATKEVLEMIGVVDSEAEPNMQKEEQKHLKGAMVRQIARFHMLI